MLSMKLEDFSFPYGTITVSHPYQFSSEPEWGIWNILLVHPDLS